MTAKFLLIAILLSLSVVAVAQAASGPYLNITEPYNATALQNGSIYLGKVGPGQTFYVTASSATSNSTGTLYGIGWDELVASSLPNGWIAQNSALYTTTPSIKITVAPKAANGTYSFNITAVNLGNYSKLGSLKLTAYVNVTPNVFKLSVNPSTIEVGPGQPADIYVTINNTGVSDSPFNITVHGLPAWNSSRTVIALHHTQGRFVYQVYENEPGAYNLGLYVSSIASPLIYKQSNITLTTKASLASDYEALGNGALSFPVIYAPAYAIMYLISLISKYV